MVFACPVKQASRYSRRTNREDKSRVHRCSIVFVWSSRYSRRRVDPWNRGNSMHGYRWLNYPTIPIADTYYPLWTDYGDDRLCWLYALYRISMISILKLKPLNLITLGVREGSKNCWTIENAGWLVCKNSELYGLGGIGDRGDLCVIGFWLFGSFVKFLGGIIDRVFGRIVTIIGIEFPSFLFYRIEVFLRRVL